MTSRPRSLIITKKPRSDPIPDIPISFPPLENLHLELLEVKKKLKKNLPLISIIKKKFLPKVILPPSLPDEIQVVSTKEVYTQPNIEEKHENSDSEQDILKEFGDDIPPEKEEPLPPKKEELPSPRRDDVHSPKREDVPPPRREDVQEEPENPEEPEEYDPYAGLTPEEREAKEKEEYVWRFRILKKQYKNPQVTIPDYNEHSDLPEMKRTYDRTIKELYLDDAVETYRTYLVGGFIFMEFACIQWMNIDLEGFTIQQTQMMHKYDRLLIELGEKSYGGWGSNLPVEIRLIGTVLLSAGIFYLGKIITDRYGGKVSELFKGFTGQPPDPIKSKSNSPEFEPTTRSQKGKMRGPKIKPSDIKNMSHYHDEEEDD